MFTPSFTPRGERTLLFRRMKGRTEGLHPALGDKFMGTKYNRWRSNFAARDAIKNFNL
jgi:hypothetical protein